jgi:DNA polymerase (family 10)
MLFTNFQISQILKQHADALEVTGADSFKISAYRRAADSIEHLSSEVSHIWKEGDLTSIPGVGESIAAHLDELFRTGRVRKFERLHKKLPLGMFELTKIPGVGGRRAFRLAKKLKLVSISDLKKAIADDKVAALEGFGQKSQKELSASIAEWERRSNRILLFEALFVAEDYLGYLREFPPVKRAEALGSLRRRCVTVGDIDLAAATDNPQAVIKHFTAYPQVAKVISRGSIKATVMLKSGLQIDIMTCRLSSWGALLQHFTGSKLHNIALRKVAQEQGWTLSEKAPIREEFGVYEKLKLTYIEPELREGVGEVEAANLKQPKLPKLLNLSDIKADLQMHTEYSDGINTIEEMANKANILSYQYISITDHNPSIKTNSRDSVKKWINNRKKEFIRAERKFPNLKIINGVEVNIPASGGLALPNELLKEFDWVIASVHSSFKKGRGEQTRRILSALENPHVHALGHPTGRILLERHGIDVDWEEIFKFATKHNKLMEINAYPSRLDLPDTLVRKARDLGVKFEISTDAHSIEHLDYMRFGVYIARRGWLEKKDVVNTLSYKDFRSHLRERR